MSWELRIVLTLATVLGMAMMAAGVAVIASRRRAVASRLDLVVQDHQDVPAAGEAVLAAQRPAEQSPPSPHFDIDAGLLSTRWGQRLRRWLGQAGLEIGVGAYLMIHLSAGPLGALLALLVGAQPLQAALAGLGGLYLPWWFVRSRRARRRDRFALQLPDTVLLLASGLRAGLSLLQAVQRAAQESPEPMASELRGVLREAQVGATVWAALRNLAARTGGRDLDLLVAILDVHREVGGNIAPLMASTAEMMQNRQRLAGEVRVLTAQQRLAAQVLFSMPVALAFIMFLINPTYMLELLSPDPLLFGLPVYLLPIIAALLLLLGLLSVRRASEVEV